MRLQTWKPQKFKEKLIGNHKETQKTLKISGLFHFTRLVLICTSDVYQESPKNALKSVKNGSKSQRLQKAPEDICFPTDVE